MQYDREWYSNLSRHDFNHFYVHLTFEASLSSEVIGKIIEQLLEITSQSCMVGRSFGKRGRIWILGHALFKDINYLLEVWKDSTEIDNIMSRDSCTTEVS